MCVCVFTKRGARNTGVEPPQHTRYVHYRTRDMCIHCSLFQTPLFSLHLSHTHTHITHTHTHTHTHTQHTHTHTQLHKVGTKVVEAAISPDTHAPSQSSPGADSESCGRRGVRQGEALVTSASYFACTQRCTRSRLLYC